MLDADSIQPDITLDFRSLRCPNLLITVIKEIEAAQPGHILCIVASDLNAPSSLGSWTRQSGHTLLDMYQESDAFIFLIQCQPVANSQQLKTNNLITEQ